MQNLSSFLCLRNIWWRRHVVHFVFVNTISINYHFTSLNQNSSEQLKGNPCGFEVDWVWWELVIMSIAIFFVRKCTNMADGKNRPVSMMT